MLYVYVKCKKILIIIINYIGFVVSSVSLSRYWHVLCLSKVSVIVLPKCKLNIAPADKTVPISVLVIIIPPAADTMIPPLARVARLAAPTRFS